MNPVELVDKLVDFSKKVVKDYDLPTKNGESSKSPNIYPGYLPDKKKGDEQSEFPYVIIRFLSEQDKEDDKVNIRFIIATYSEDEVNGWRDPVNIATRIKIALKKQQIFGPFSLNGEIKIDLFEDQPFPQWFATMDVTFVIPQVQMDWSEQNFGY